MKMKKEGTNISAVSEIPKYLTKWNIREETYGKIYLLKIDFRQQESFKKINDSFKM